MQRGNTIKYKEENLNLIQERLSDFNAIKKAMESIAFLAFGDIKKTDSEIRIYSACLSLLNFKLWQIFSSKKSFVSIKEVSDFKMFLLPIIGGSWKTDNAPEYKKITKDTFEVCSREIFKNREELFKSLMEGLNELSRKNSYSPILYQDLRESYQNELYKVNLNSINDLIKSDNVYAKTSVANREILVVVIITTFLCQKFNKNDKQEHFLVDYSVAMSLIIRLALLLDGDFLKIYIEMSNPSLLKAIDDIINDYSVLKNEFNLTNVMEYLFGSYIEKTNTNMVYIERELFRITQNLFSISKDSKIRAQTHRTEVKDASYCLINEDIEGRVLQNLFGLHAHKEPDNRIMYDEENFYYLLVRILEDKK